MFRNILSLATIAATTQAVSLTTTTEAQWGLNDFTSFVEENVPTEAELRDISLKAAFDKIDAGGNGFIEAAELATLLIG